MKEKKFLFVLFIILIFSFSWSFQDSRRIEDDKREKGNTISLNKIAPFRYQGPRYASGEVLVKFNPSLSEQKIESRITTYKSRNLKRIPRLDIYQIQIPEDVEVMDMISMMSQDPDIEYAEPNYIAYMTVTPNDSLFRHQYALYNEGQDIGIPGSPQGLPRADIKATEAWEETNGDEDIIIAVLDTGVDMFHVDLFGKILHGGRDFVNEDFDATDDNYHGTLVAGIAAADTNNYEGMAGVAWDCKILPVKVLDEEGLGTFSDVMEGIIWAVDNGAHVVNLSLGAEIGSVGLEEAVRYAYEASVVVVAAAGNEGGAVLYPAAYDAYCLAVAATDNVDQRVTFLSSGGVWESNIGPEVDVAAPGENILSTVPTWFWGPGSFPYAYGSGTSVATPHVAGLAALIKTIKPWLTAGEIMDIIRFAADDVNSSTNPGTDEFLGHGRANMQKSLVPTIITSSK
ncbi:MAG: S8 family serine peptidase [Candidatus Aminicenantes bacterium]|nr:S8 family serine peptidase [Candidatus Aminicenantes bacterium]